MHAVFRCKKDSGSTWEIRTHIKSVFFTADIFAVYTTNILTIVRWDLVHGSQSEIYLIATRTILTEYAKQLFRGTQRFKFVTR